MQFNNVTCLAGVVCVSNVMPPPDPEVIEYGIYSWWNSEIWVIAIFLYHFIFLKKRKNRTLSVLSPALVIRSSSPCVFMYVSCLVRDGTIRLCCVRRIKYKPRKTQTQMQIGPRMAATRRKLFCFELMRVASSSFVISGGSSGNEPLLQKSP